MKDPVLELLVKFSETEPPLETEITLVAGGFLISGYVVSMDNYLTHHPVMEGVGDALRNLHPEETTAADALSEHERNFIHLRDAKYFLPGESPVPGNAGVYCRISLVSISAFHFGLLSPA